jgi:hypothetical protein
MRRSWEMARSPAIKDCNSLGVKALSAVGIGDNIFLFLVTRSSVTQPGLPLYLLHSTLVLYPGGGFVASYICR